MAQDHYESLFAKLAENGFDSREFVRQVVERGLQELVDAGVAAHIGAGPHERTPERKTRRNGKRSRTLTTQAGDVVINLPKLREGSWFPDFLEPRRRVDQALYAVVMTAYISGTSTRKVDRLVKAMGSGHGISKSEVSRICKLIDEQVRAFRERPLDRVEYPYLYIDATYVKARKDHRVRSRAVAIATAVTAEGRRQVLGFCVGDAEDQPFWEDFLGSLAARGLGGVKLVISDAHASIKAAVQAALPGAAWQACRIHFARNIAKRAGNRHNQRLAMAALASIYHQADRELAVTQYHWFSAALEKISPRLADYVEDREVELTAYADFPPVHWRKIWSTNPLERLMAEVKRRSRVVQIFPNDASVVRLVGAILCEQNDEWIAAERRYMSRASMNQIGKVVAWRDDIDGSTGELVPAPKDWALQRAQEIYW